MKTLYLHIGDGKTGTSFLQSLFAANRQKLDDLGVLYPVAGNAHLQAERGRVTGGNWAVVEEENWTGRFAGTDVRNILISAERLIGNALVSTDTELDTWERWRQDLGFDRVAVLMFIRDPVDHAASLFQQAFKTGKLRVDSLAKYFLEYQRPYRLAELLKHLMERDTFDVSVYNYSRCKSELRAIAATWLGIDQDALEKAPASVVNRGLTFAELGLVGALARIDAAQGLRLANAFSNSLPDLKPFRAVPALDVQTQMLTKLAPAMSEIESMVGAESALLPTTREPDSNRTMSLSLQQWRVVLKSTTGNGASPRDVWKAIRTRNAFTFD